MAQLFDRNKLSEAVATIGTEEIQPFLEIVRGWHHDLHHGTLLLDKETSREQAYNQDFFVRILGYREKPALPFSMEPKATTDAKNYPDVVLGHFDGSTRNVGAVVELKGAAISLDRPQKRESNLTPVQQGFKYKVQYRSCPFVVVSNFQEFRIYNDNQLDYNSWTLDDLVDPANDYFGFKSWFYLLHSSRLTAETGESLTEQLLTDIRIEQEAIGENLYARYANARQHLINSILTENPSYQDSPQNAITFAQTVIDRIVFVAFAEDRGLLPSNTLLRVKLESERSALGLSFWDNLKVLFKGIDTGTDALGIPNGYNGGLFKADPELDQLSISDDALAPLIELSEFDYSHDSSVAILGRIFEQSVSDIEQLKSSVSATGGTIIPRVSRRKKDGIFYTPDYIVRYMVDQTLGKYLRNLEKTMQQEVNLHGDLTDENYERREKEAYTRYQQELQKIQVLDPACGSGAFLVHVFDFLLAENRRVGEILNTLFDTEDFYKEILQNNLFGVDLNEESVEITKLSLWLKTAIKDKQLTTLDNNIKVGNSLTLDWSQEFPTVLSGGGFEVILMNPPYIKEDENKDAFASVKTNPIYQGKMDIWYMFGGLALDLIQEETGYVGIIAQNNWVTSDGAQKFRNKVIEEARIERFVDFGAYNVFKEAGIQTMIMICRKSNAEPRYEFPYQKLEIRNARESDVTDFLTQVDTEGSLRFTTRLDRAEALNETITFVPPKAGRIIETIAANGSFFIDSKTEIFSGIDGQETVRKKDAERLSQIATQPIQSGDGIFVLTREELKAKNFGAKDMELVRPIFSTTEINRFFASNSTDSFVIFTDSSFRDPKSLDEYPGIKRHLDPYQPIMTSANKPYGLHRPRDTKIYSGERIFVVRKSVGRPRFSYVDFEAYFNRTFNVIKTDRIDNKFLTGVLNSSLVAYWLKFQGKMQGDNFQVDMRPLGSVPVATTDNIQPIVALHDRLCDLNSDLYDSRTKFVRTLRTLYSIRAIPRALSRWWDLDFTEFYQTLGLKLHPSAVADLGDYFQTQTRIVRDLLSQIQKEEFELDELVFDLYEILPEDRQTVRAVVMDATDL
ncbi:N-6 DNA methylase [Corynebacterium sp. Marseille-P4321]|uniref:Eco57I restriction-modification methylase domain-containing protein n=1 Tax=Corynebacterium sp. Marseille-P4321 TaxID=2736603 RepID=UPI00158C7F27|nr:N-6 DNA methylase [Corynebacterium sp. Marseille-P4321]